MYKPSYIGVNHPTKWPQTALHPNPLPPKSVLRARTGLLSSLVVGYVVFTSFIFFLKFLYPALFSRSVNDTYSLVWQNYQIHKFPSLRSSVGRFWGYIRIHLPTVSPHPAFIVALRKIRELPCKTRDLSVITAFSWTRSGWTRTSFVVRPIQITVWRETQSCTS